MNKCTSAILFLASVFGFAPSALAGDLSAMVTAAVEPVSWSIGSSQPAATYKVIVKDESFTATIDRPRLVGSTAVIDGLADAKAVYRSAEGVTCTVINLAGTAIECAIPSLPPQDTHEFEVTFVSPTSGLRIAFDWQAVFDQGAPPGGSNSDEGMTPIALDQPDANKVTSYVPANVEVNFFTGGGVATKDDPWVTIVNVPAGSTTSTATVNENPQDSSCPAGQITCRSSTLTIPGEFPGLLEITLLRDSSTISRNQKIEDAVVYYRKTELSAFEPVLPCSETNPPESGVPCEDLAQRYAYPSKSSRRAPVPTELLGDWRFVIYALDNGRYAN
jgi:hypothetical protein